jgi:hypothetical protein
MKIHKYKYDASVEYWYDPYVRVWYAIKVDNDGNQISYCLDSYRKSDLISMIQRGDLETMLYSLRD